jgi:predicted nuclease of predicted toxin-antitoxin system
MKLLIDMNLSPQWALVLEEAGWEAVHWSRIGRPNAPDHEVLAYARYNDMLFSRTTWTLEPYLPPQKRIVQV